jgi:hypothetical protein
MQDGGAGGGGGASWINSYLAFSNAAFEKGWKISTSQFDFEFYKQTNSPGYNGTITFSLLHAK